MDKNNPSYGYHKRIISKGELGEVSKIKEELEEFEDALDQKNPVMALVELSDLYGSIKLYLEKYHPTISMEDLKTMNEATTRSFMIGHRKTKE